jgi:hypothetical protein
MAKLFDTEDRIVPTWLAAARYLDSQRPRKGKNLVLEIPNPLALTEDDRAMMAKVDQALAHCNLTLKTVAGTIFPTAMYKRYGRPGYYDKYKEMLKRGQAKNTWGTYAHRMIERPGKVMGTTINPLEHLVNKLSYAGQPQPANGIKVSYVATYELNVADPEEDLRPEVDVGGDVPTYNPAFDMREWLGLPCLSHLSFKRVPRGEGHAVDLTAIYRSHHYCARALGNLLGLAQLLSFVAKESGLQVGTLSCLSTHAELDVDKWGGVAVANAVLAV